MAYKLSQLRLARVVLEARTALSISTGSPDGVFDSALIRDANQLPVIPASSFAGVLRSLWLQRFGSESSDSLFGFQRRDKGITSRLHISWGYLLDSRGLAATGLLMGKDGQARLDDPLFKSVLAQREMPVHRNRVRMTHRGAAADQGKFDRGVLPAGHRFALEIRYFAHADEDSALWDSVLSLLSHPGLRLGGATRAGLGRMACLSIHAKTFDLTQKQDVHALGKLGANPSETHDLNPVSLTEEPTEHWKHATLTLNPKTLWRIGQGDFALGRYATYARTPDLLPVSEQRIIWSNGRAEINTQREVIIPAASLKGVLAHRMAFHARRFAETWAEHTELNAQGEPLAPPEVRALFGELKDKTNGQQDSQGRAGCLFIDDAYLRLKPENVTSQMHNSIDRFTGGVREHFLFEEELIHQGEAKISMAIDLARLSLSAKAFGTSLASVQRAWLATWRDLAEGRLAIGSRSTSGHGFMQADVPEAFTQDWKNPKTSTEHV